MFESANPDEMSLQMNQRNGFSAMSMRTLRSIQNLPTWYIPASAVFYGQLLCSRGGDEEMLDVA